jgi:hypothetical protein
MRFQTRHYMKNLFVPIEDEVAGKLFGQFSSSPPFVSIADEIANKQYCPNSVEPI